MGPDQLAGVMGTIQKQGRDAAQAAKERDRLRDDVERDSQCYRTSAALLDDGVIDPRDTRDVLGMALEVVYSEPILGAASHQALARL